MIRFTRPLRPSRLTGTSLADVTLASHHRRGRISPAVQEQIFATQRPFSVDAFNSKSGAPAWKTIPSWCLFTTDSTLISTHEVLFFGSLCEILHLATIHLAACTRVGTRPTLKSGEAD